MEARQPKATIEKISPNLASLIASYLTFRDLLNIGATSSRLRTIFYEFHYSWLEILKNTNLPASLRESLKTNAEIIDLFSKKVIKTDKYYMKLRLDGKNWIIFEASEVYYDWKGSEYWPLEKHENSWFGEKPIPHLKSVCWFRIYGDFLIPRGRYSLNFRIAADHNFNLNNSYYYLMIKDQKENLLKFVVDSEVESRLKSKKGGFDILKLGEFDLSAEQDKEITVCLRSQEGDDWWKHGFWLDAIIFIPL